MKQREGLVWVPEDLPEVPRHRESKEPLYQGVIALLNRVLRVQDIKVTVFGAEHVPVDSGAIMAMNHTGYYDFIFGQIAPYVRGRRLTRFMAKKEIFDVPVVGTLMRAMHHVPVDRSAGAGSVDEAVRHLKAGSLVTIFPEATISRSFELKEFKNGAARIAALADVPLIPVVTFGSQRIWTKGAAKHLGRSHTPVLIRVGEPIALSGDATADTKVLRETMSSMLGELRQQYLEMYGPFEKGLEWMPASLGGSAPTPAEADKIDAEVKAAKAAKKAAKDT